MPLEALLRERITQSGAVNVAEFMTLALSHPEHGYYKKHDPFGGKGDFTTAPEISQVFGEMIGIWCASVWQQMGCPSDIALVEMGPGRGTLMQDLLRGTAHIPDFHRALDIHMVETSPKLRDMQRDTLSDTDIDWHSYLSTVPQKPMLLVANELFDALPIHQYSKTEKGWCERMIAINSNGSLVYAHSPVVPFSGEIDKTHQGAPLGAIVEIGQAGIGIMQDIATRIAAHGGAALILDYGYSDYDYTNTLQALQSHKHHKILEDIGNADISAHVDFNALAITAQNCGVQASPIATQRDFLLGMGIELRRERLLQKATPAQAEEIKSAIDRLINPEQMGTLFKVLEISR